MSETMEENNASPSPGDRDDHRQEDDGNQTKDHQQNKKSTISSKFDNNPLSQSAKVGRFDHSLTKPSPQTIRRTRSADRVSNLDDVLTSERVTELSKPKAMKAEWWTSYGQRVLWGTQNLIQPISAAAQNAEATERVRFLATPKRDLQGPDQMIRTLHVYSCGRSSQLWVTSQFAQKAEASERVQFLANPKKPHPCYQENRRQFEFSCGRSSALWEVSRPAIEAGDRERTLYLARAKEVHPSYLPLRRVQTVIPEAAMKATITARVNTLANPKDRPVGPFRESEWPVTDTAKNASASNRCLELAKPKGLAEGYLPLREVAPPVSWAAKRALITSRLHELAKPLVRASMDHVQFNPDAFLVKPTALKGSIPKRIADLSQPVVR